MSNSLGAYVHIPFCIQRCHYCDFATYAKDQIAPNSDYVDAVCQEISLRRPLFSEKSLQTIYFGGGTPSLLAPKEVEKIIQCFEKNDFVFDDDIEITLEVNPATLTASKSRDFKQAGINRISLGCQSFNDDYLKACNREHSAQDTRDTIELIKKDFHNFSLDLLFSLPKQGLKNLEEDLKEILTFAPPHVSAYCLTLVEKHPMNVGRCSEEEQVEMFELITSYLSMLKLERYELSNFSKVGFESRHNNLYWTDRNYWGVGLSAHSYRKEPHWGYRFWNASTYSTYLDQVKALRKEDQIESSFPKQQFEKLQIHESLSDYCHTFLRMSSGLKKQTLRQKFGDNTEAIVSNRLTQFQPSGLIEEDPIGWKLTEKGFLLSNQVFKELIFSSEDIDKL